MQIGILPRCLPAEIIKRKSDLERLGRVPLNWTQNSVQASSLIAATKRSGSARAAYRFALLINVSLRRRSLHFPGKAGETCLCPPPAVFFFDISVIR